MTAPSSGANPNDHNIVQREAGAAGIPFWVLWGIYGAESTWGKLGSNWFGLVAVPRTGSFAGDAAASAKTIATLRRQFGSWEQAFRKYSGGGYGLAHIRDLVGNVASESSTGADSKPDKVRKAVAKAKRGASVGAAVGRQYRGPVIQVGPSNRVYCPGYDIKVYANGNPKKLRTGVNFGTTLSITTSKSLNDVSGTFTINLKDEAALSVVRSMDVVRILLRGHDADGITYEVLRGVVDEVVEAGDADVESASEGVVIQGRCLGKYLQVTSLFLPVWDPNTNLPTATIYGIGRPTQDPSNPNIGTTPLAIFGHLLRTYTFGLRNTVGGGIPNSRFWLDYRSRFGSLNGYQVPYVQFDEDTIMSVLKTFEMPGFCEAWVDELGRIVYRSPGWDAPVRYSVSTGALTSWSLSESDLEVATYVEVVPAGDPGISSGAAQALMAGRAPVPSSYVQDKDGADTQLGQYVSPEFLIDTDSKGVATAKGRKNKWYRLQRRLGLRPQQFSSPLLATQRQAQAQAEGLLQFYSRYTKSGQITIPGDARIKLGETLLLHGELEGVRIGRTYYIEAVQHSYNEGQGYTTTLQLSHGRDPDDPKWGRIVLPAYDPAELAQTGGILAADDSNDGTGNPYMGGAGGNQLAGRPANGSAQKVASYPLAKRGTLGGGSNVPGSTHDPNAYPDNWQSDNAVDIYVPNGTPVLAVDDGKISENYGFGMLASDGGRFAGIRMHLETKDNVWYYAHLSRIAPGIRPGVSVQAGTILGYSGEANGVFHLHIGCERGKPETLLGL